MSKKRPSGCPAFRPSPWVLESPSGGFWAENGRQEGQKIDKLNKKWAIENPCQNRCRKGAKKYAPGFQKDAQMESKIEDVAYSLEKGEKWEITLPLQREHDFTGFEDTNK